MLAWPTPVDASAAGLLASVIVWLESRGFGWVNYGLVEFAANVGLFVPIGFLVAFVGPRLRSSHVILGAAFLSSSAEIAQSVLRPERFGTLQDVLANTLGAALGFVLARSLRTHRSDPPHPAPQPGE